MFSVADMDPEQENENEEDEENVSGPCPSVPSAFIAKVRTSRVPLPYYPSKEHSFVTIAPFPGTMNTNIVVSDGAFIVDNTSYEKVKVGTDLTAEADWTRRGLYIGPQFELTLSSRMRLTRLFLSLLLSAVSMRAWRFIPGYTTHKGHQASQI